MRVTTKDISRLARVSRATVSRVLNNKPGVLPHTRDAVLEVVRSLNYQPNLLGKALASKKAITLGVIALPEKHVFGPSLLQGLRMAEAQYRDYGLRLRIHAPRDLEPAHQAQEIRDMLRAGVDGLALVAIEDAEVVRAVGEAVARGIPVVTFNNTFQRGEQLCFVGQDAFQSGQVAADLLACFMGGRGDIFVLNGLRQFIGHCRRLEGFESVLREHYPAVRIVARQECRDDEAVAFELTRRALADHPALGGIYVVGAGIGAMCQALLQDRRAGRPRVVCYDLPGEAVHFLREGVIDAVITQDPVTQGHLPIKILFELLFEGKAPSQPVYHTKTEIITRFLLGAPVAEKVLR